jgi:tRNA-specific 2-thiouridylase
MNKQRIVVGLSGGVDSSVAAWLLKEQGYDVVGVFMRNWNDESVTINNECPWIDDSADAMLVAESIGIPFQVIDLSDEYKKRIVDYMFREYEMGLTPNPDILCNREIKFDVFLNHALSLDADFVATGHYCRKTESVIDNKKVYHLLSGKDANKDQSYFLCQLTQQQLSKALFPIGKLQKSEVREIAKKAGLVTADKKDSQGLCFIGKVRLPEFLQQQLKPKKGKVIEISANSALYENLIMSTELKENYSLAELEELSKEIRYSESDGKLLGEHNGAHFYTIGQRKGMNIGGTPLPLFVLAKDTATNIVYVGQGENHPGLYRKALELFPDQINWINKYENIEDGESKFFDSRIRYRQKLEKSLLSKHSQRHFITFENPQKSIAKGQFAAWYIQDELIGSGVIK